MAMKPPSSNWSKLPLGRDEKLWTYLMIVMLLMMGIMATGYVFLGDQNPPEQYRQVPVDEYYQVALDGNDEAGLTPTQLKGADQMGYKVPDGGDVYMVASQWNWFVPVTNSSTGQPSQLDAIQIKVDTQYRLHLGSLDVLHGFQLIGTDFLLTIQVVPGYDYIIDFIPRETGTFRIVCNEYCGAQHHQMMGYLEVVA